MCRLRNIAIRDYEESVTTGQTHASRDRRRTKWSLCAAMLRRSHKNCSLFLLCMNQSLLSYWWSCAHSRSALTWLGNSPGVHLWLSHCSSTNTNIIIILILDLHSYFSSTVIFEPIDFVWITKEYVGIFSKTTVLRNTCCLWSPW